MEILPIKIRQGKLSDEDFVYSSWIHCLGNSKPYSSLDRNWFAAAQHALIERLLNRSRVFIACDPEDEDQIYGYIVGELDRAILHWVYVKQRFRKVNVATRLFEAALPQTVPCIASIRTPAFSQLEKRWDISFRSHALCEKHV